ncbi:hypothetical protein AA103196_2553 [Ameyamaea chiangmaiensis NBRC 103196]|uniref:Heme exporter protein D n=1 Tax=Ameyamaea chiangmaiensis TaxID=442969 RepID=A0A850PB12_9PROT|nr:hypothetical protein [Ameyamaea chiangmaiensis]MBS4075645.1 hypothetical protein [Ameyamaea chiangmaiensis]NVN41717.1 hypothetical protein [Ameyamaea chiangmaiensis]GBQ70663.1 hypothetical protein AA103196_2553 [Ameyamaea chiangmaiensis NBRC 103196]
MTHLPYIAGAYGLAAMVALWFGIGATLRLRRARTRLAAVEAARTRGGGDA